MPYIILQASSSYDGLLIVLVSFFVLIEIIISLSQGNSNYRIIKNDIIRMKELQSLLLKRDEELFAKSSEEDLSDPVLDYLATCADKEQQIDVRDFSKLLTAKTEHAFYSINSTINILPIIGLMGTFLGIIIGVILMWNYMESSSNQVDVENAIRPLLLSAGLAFISSFCALLSASILKGVFGRLKKISNEETEKTEKALVVDYIPYISPKTTEDRFARTVNKLNRSVQGFVTGFESSLIGFFSEFKPLVEDQKLTNAKTMKSMENIAENLNQNTNILMQLSSQQDRHTGTMEDIISKLQSAGSSLENSIKIAADSLDKFQKLSADMKNDIAKMHEPLQRIIENLHKTNEDNERVVSEIKKLFENINQLPEYLASVKQYLNTLNSKIDVFTGVGEVIGKVTKDLNVFEDDLDKLLKRFIANSETLTQTVQNSFKEYDRDLHTLFQNTIPEKDNVQLFYYDPEAINQLKGIAEKNNAMIENIRAYAGSLEKSTEKLNEAFDSLRVWGFLRKKKPKKGNKK